MSGHALHPDELADVLKRSGSSIRLTYVFGHGLCAQIYDRSREVGPVLIPTEHQTLGDLLKILGDLAQPQTLAQRRAESQ